MNAPMLPARMRLRAATDAIHRALHGATPFAAIADGTATRESYGMTLAGLHCYHTVMAPACACGAVALEMPHLAVAHAARVKALERDLEYLGIVASPVDVAETAGNPDFCIGSLYTVLGSTLGGKLIHRQLDALLAGDEGRRFFKGTPEDGRNWQGFCARLDAHACDMAKLEEGALAAFERFRQVFAA